jgi:FlaA1/EpsC-like NDP-sugar epimerase
MTSTLHRIEALSRRQKSIVALLADALLAPVALWLALLTTPPPGLVIPGGTLADGAALLPALMLVAAWLSHATGIARTPLSDFELGALVRTGVFAGCLAAALGMVAGLMGLAFPVGVCAVFGAFYLLAVLIARVAMQRAIVVLRRSRGPRCHVLIYGAGATGRQLAAALRSHDSIEVAAFVDDNPALHGLKIGGLTVLPPLRLTEVARERGVRRVLLALPSLSRPKQQRLVRELERAGLEVMALPSFAQLVGAEPLVERLTPVKAGRLLGRESHGAALRGGGDRYRGRSVLISGAGGSIGSELSRQVLTCRPRRVVLFELSELALYTVEQELAPMAAEVGAELVPVLGSVCDDRQVRCALERHEVDVVLHAAAYKHVPLVQSNPLAGLSNNVLGTRTLAQAAIDAGVRRFVLVSSDKAVRPTGVMGASKRMAELVVQDLASKPSRTRFACVRFGNVLGSSGSVVPLFQEQVARGGPVTLTHPDVTRYFMTTEEAVRLVLMAGAMARGDETFVLHMGEPMRIRDLARSVIEAQGYTVRDAAHPDGDVEIVTTGLRPGEKLHEELTVTGRSRPTDHPKIFAVREGRLPSAEVAAMLGALEAAIAASDPAAAIAAAARCVEGGLGGVRPAEPAPAPARIAARRAAAAWSGDARAAGA